MTPTTIQLSVEEALSFQQHDSRLIGFVAGVQAMADHMRRAKIDEIIAARKPAPPESSNETPK